MNRYLPAIRPKKGAKPVTPKYPSNFGSHKTMINEEETAKLSDEDRFEYVDDTAYGLGVRKIEYVVCQDDYGNYKTRKNHLDNGLADPYRNASGRLGAIKKGKKKE